MSTEKKEKNGQAWKYVMVGGVPGILMGAGGTAMAATLGDDAAGPDEDDKEPVIAAQGNGVAVAEVDDDMSFGEAFAAAREEVGPGGVFEWNGNLYNTYTAEEWAAMDSEQRDEFAGRVNNTDRDIVEEDTVASEDVSEDVADVQEETESQEVSGESQNAEESSEDVADPAVEGVTVEEVVEGEPEIEVVSVEEVVTEDGVVVTMAEAYVDGHTAMMADLDHDGVVDVMVVDENDDMVADESEILDVRNEGITVDDMSLLAENQSAVDETDAMYAGTPDYMNDADTASFA